MKHTVTRPRWFEPRTIVLRGTCAQLIRKVEKHLYSPTSGSKEKKTYIHTNTVKKQQTTASKCRLHATMLLHAIIQ